MGVADQTFYFAQSQCADAGLTSSSADPLMPGAWQGGRWSADFWVTGILNPEISRHKWDSNPRSSAPGADTLTTRPARRYCVGEIMCEDI